MRVHVMSKMKSAILALAASTGFLLSASPAAAVGCISSSATNFCHATFDINKFTSSTFTTANITTNVKAQTSGSTSVKNAAAATASAQAVTDGFNATTGANTNAPSGYTVGGSNYNIDGSGYGALSLKALKTVTTQITWTATQAGPFAFDWLVSGQSSSGAEAYVVIDGTQTLLTQSATSLAPVAGHTTVNVGLGQTLSFLLIGTTNNALLNSAQLEVSSFKGVPEINGGVLPLGLLLLGLAFIAVKRKDAEGGLDEPAGL